MNVGERAAARRARMMQIARWTRLGALAFIVALVAPFAAVQLFERDEIRGGVHAFGVDLGGMTRTEARAALLAAAETQMGQPLVLVDGERQWTFTAADLGLTIDVDAAVEDAFEHGRVGNGPSRLALLWQVRDRPHEIGRAHIAVQVGLLDQVVRQVTSDIQQARVDPMLMLDAASGVSYTEAQVGRELNVDRTREAVLEALAGGDSQVVVVVDETPPLATNQDYAAVRQQLDHIWDSPIEVVAAEERWVFTPDVVSSRLTVVPAAGGEPARLEIDEQWLDEAVWELTVTAERAPRGARIWWGAGGSLVKMDDGTRGIVLDESQAWDLMRATLLGIDPTNRLELPVTYTDPPALPADLNTLGITGMLAESSTPYAESIPAKKHNIELAAERINGALILPGQTFSFNAEVGRTTVAAGFEMGYGIAASENGQLQTIPSEAGGICQVATTVFQPVFWTGYRIDVRSTHSYWIPSYAYNGLVGLDATVDEARGVDFKWTNDSPTAVLLEAVADGENFTVRLYGTSPPWSVELDPPQVSNIILANQDVVYQETDTLPTGQSVQIERANDGFDVSVVRRVIEGDATRVTELEATYGPSRNVILVGQ